MKFVEKNDTSDQKNMQLLNKLPTIGSWILHGYWGGATPIIGRIIGRWPKSNNYTHIGYIYVEKNDIRDQKQDIFTTGWYLIRLHFLSTIASFPAYWIWFIDRRIFRRVTHHPRNTVYKKHFEAFSDASPPPTPLLFHFHFSILLIIEISCIIVSDRSEKYHIEPFALIFCDRSGKYHF